MIDNNEKQGTTRVRATISALFTDTQRLAVGAYCEDKTWGLFDEDGNRIRRTDIRKATHDELKDYLESYGWAGFANLNDIIGELLLDER